MFTVEGLRQQYGWAHDSFARLLDHCDTLSNEELHRKLDGFGFNSVWAQLLHMAETELFWFLVAQGKPWLEIKDEDYPDVAALRSLFAQAKESAGEYFAGLKDETLAEDGPFEWEPGQGVRISPAKIVSHVLTHGFHHKGQIVAMCRLLGHPASETDLA